MCDHEVKIFFSFKKKKNEIFCFCKDDCEDGSDENNEQCREYL